MQNEVPKKQGKFIDFSVGAFLIALGLGVGYFYVDTQPKQWKASAIFEAPRVAELGNYFSLYSTYHLVQNEGKSDPNLEKVVADNAYAEFKRALNAPDARKQFLTDNGIVKQIADVHYQSLNETVSRLSEKLHFDDSSNTLSLTLTNPELATKMLEQYIVYSQNMVRNTLNNDLIAKWKFLFQNVKQSAEANLGANWQGKYNLMRSVQPLDNQLIAYHFVQKPLASVKPEMPEKLIEALTFGGGLGLLLSFLFAFLRRK